jgi:hypothetical protein
MKDFDSNGVVVNFDTAKSHPTTTRTCWLCLSTAENAD